MVTDLTLKGYTLKPYCKFRGGQNISDTPFIPHVLHGHSNFGSRCANDLKRPNDKLKTAPGNVKKLSITINLIYGILVLGVPGGKTKTNLL